VRAFRFRDRRSPRASVVAVLALGTLGLAACGDSGNPAPGTTTLRGALAATGGLSGTLTVTADGAFTPQRVAGSGPVALSVAAPAAVLNLSATASLSNGSTVTLTGTWDTGTGALSLSGGGFSFTGIYRSGSVSGTFTGPQVTGIFSLQIEATSGAVAVYCGTYTGRQPQDFPSGGTGEGPENGAWNVIVGPATATAVVVNNSGGAAAFSGTRSGNTITLSLNGGTATGTIKDPGDAFADGTYSVPGRGLHGTFQESSAACTATAESATISAITINDPGIVLNSSSELLQHDSTLAFATAFDAQGNYVAAPDLEWTFTGRAHTNGEVTPRGQKWFVADSTGVATVTVTSTNNPNVQTSLTVNIR
jgi:hypothetical protein